MTDIKRNIRRRKHYSMLVQAGYDSTIATKLKDYDMPTVLELCKIKRSAKSSLDEIDNVVQQEVERILGGKRK